MNNGKICVSICGDTIADMKEKIVRAEDFADLIELRFDSLNKTEFDRENLEASDLVLRDLFDQKHNLPWITTFRIAEQGGVRKLTELERKNFWNSGFETEIADLEEDIVEDSFSWLWRERICSFHDFSHVPQDIDAIYDRLASTGAEIVKIAVSVEDTVEAIPVWKLLWKENLEAPGPVSPYPSILNTGFSRVENLQTIPIAMGEAGKWTRILGLAHGAFLTYASLESGNETAPGQISAQDLVETYRVRELNERTKVFGIIGDPVSQSLSPYMHNPAFASRGINAVFIPFLVKDLDAFVRRMVRPETSEVGLDFGGLSVTMPHKQAIMKHLDEIDETASMIGAVNTVKVEGGRLIGYNTDAHGFITPLKKMFGDLDKARVALFGAGGAARACVFALRRARADVTVFVRDLQKAKAFAEELQVPLDLIGNARLKDFDIVVDATPFGMKGELEDKSLFTADELAGLRFVYDLVTKPYDTPIVREAKKANVPTLGGLEMLVAQGVEQFRIWTGEEPSGEEMKASLTARLSK